MKNFMDKNISRLCTIGVIVAGLAAATSMPVFAVRAGFQAHSAGSMAKDVEKALDRPAPRKADPAGERNWSALRNVFKAPGQERMPELVGIWGSTALFDSGGGQVSAYAVGDMVGNYKLVSIGNMQAVLVGEQGEVPVALGGYRPPAGWKPPKGAAPFPPSATQPGVPSVGGPMMQVAPVPSIDDNEMRRRMRDFARERFGGRRNPNGPGN